MRCCIPLIWSCSFCTSGDSQKTCRLAGVGTDQRLVRFSDRPSAQGRQVKKGSETPNFAMRSPPFTTHQEKNSMSPCCSSVSSSDCSTHSKCVFFACSPHETSSFPELVLTSVEARHRRSLADFSRGSLLNNLYLQCTLQRLTEIMGAFCRAESSYETCRTAVSRL